MKTGRFNMSMNTAQQGRQCGVQRRRLGAGLLPMLALLLVGCASSPFKAPVEDRNTGSKPVAIHAKTLHALSLEALVA